MRTLLSSCLLLALGACTLGPLDEGDPVSVNLLPPGTELPYVGDDSELVYQISVHDGLDDGDLEEAMGVIPLSVGWANGQEVRYWKWGNTPRVGAAVYVFINGGGFPVDHPWLLDSMPGEAGYSAIRRIQTVTVTGTYDGEVISTLKALEDAIELGLVLPPESAGTWVDAPVVVPGTRLDVGASAEPAVPGLAIANGYLVDQFVLGGELGVQPLRNGAIPTAQVSEMREGSSVRLVDTAVFQLAVPTEEPVEDYNYTPLSNMLIVDLADGVVAEEMVFSDADLFVRSSTGSISATTALVDSFEVTVTYRNWPLQFEEGLP